MARELLSPLLGIVLRCEARHVPKVRYVLDTLMLAAGVSVRYVEQPSGDGPCLLYAPARPAERLPAGCLAIAHCTEAWRLFDGDADIDTTHHIDGLPVALAQRASGFDAHDIDFDLVANAFYFLSSWSERRPQGAATSRHLHANSVYARFGIPQDIVDRYLERLLDRLRTRLAPWPGWPGLEWPGGGAYALVLSHDIDFLPAGRRDIAIQGAKSFLRHLVRHLDPSDAVRAAAGWMRAWIAGRDPYGCVPAIIDQERHLGVRASFAVAVGHRHPRDVNYHVEDDRVRDYLRVIPDSGFDLCLHGSYRSTENTQWYVEEADLLAQRLARPRGSRQHFLAFDYDKMFQAQEQAGIEYDMSMGFPDHPGPRTGFSYPYFPYHLKEDRPYKVLEIGLFLMDATLRGYMRLKNADAWRVIEQCLADLRRKHGCASVVWHPIVFGGARDPGYDRLYWDMVERTGATGGLATDGRTVNRFWRARAAGYASFAAMGAAS